MAIAIKAAVIRRASIFIIHRIERVGGLLELPTRVCGFPR
jgi:hypothetical protein